MKTLKIIGILLLVFVVLFLVIGVFLPKEIRIQHSISVETKSNVIFKQVNTLANWDKWSPYPDLDPSLEFTNEGPEMGVGAVQKWIGKSEKGEMKITESNPYLEINFMLDFYEKGTSEMFWTFNEDGDFTMVTWGMDVTELVYPFERYQALIMKGFMRGVLADGLEKLKSVCEALPEIPEIKLTNFDGMPGLAIYDSAYTYDVENVMARDYGEIMAFMSENNIRLFGAPFAIYYRWNPSLPSVMNIGIPTDGLKKGKGNIKPVAIEAGNVVVGKHYGAYDKIGNTHEYIIQFIAEHKLEMNGPYWESYITDPATEADTSKWLTKIYWPVK